ncbi:cyclin-dependent kinase inhibitor 7-like [Dorcoceras hygrometricum]|uniref:Cyclin-dependent kinase inhibitor n=1 Tax=Dorcoceras hygrometricum TaxID=472368 RepID=A0A2Z7AUB4_9LAMI|nr:cyclin-dependent kinase inhibitor 7-like [Dorcoceras hygrometricum]
MGRYMRKCKRAREVAVELDLESTPQIDARMTRTSAAQNGQEKKRKSGLGESEMTESLVRLKKRLLAVVPAGNSNLPVSSGDSTCDSSGSDHVLVSCCSSSESSQLAEGSTDFVDLEEGNEEFLTTSGGDLVERTEPTPSSEAQAELGELESTAMRESNFLRRSISSQKMPSVAELEEFFSAVETKLHKQFMDKYNYDILKDEPLEGRYEWDRIPAVKP